MPRVNHLPARVVRERVVDELTRTPLTVDELAARLDLPRYDRWMVQSALRTLSKRGLVRDLQAGGTRTKLWLLTEAGYGASREAVA